MLFLFDIVDLIIIVLGVVLMGFNIISVKACIAFLVGFCVANYFIKTVLEKKSRVVKFSKVSYEQFKKDFLDTFKDEMFEEVDEEEANTIINAVYNNIKLPTRATSGSAGYDFYTTVPFSLAPNETIKIPTGIRCEMPKDTVLSIYPRSGLGFKYRLQLNNTIGIIDSDYYGSDNEGHIFVKLTNDSNEAKVLETKFGDGICQGIFTKYCITNDDDCTAKRNGGFGSTSK